MDFAPEQVRHRGGEGVDALRMTLWRCAKLHIHLQGWSLETGPETGKAALNELAI